MKALKKLIKTTFLVLLGLFLASGLALGIYLSFYYHTEPDVTDQLTKLTYTTHPEYPFRVVYGSSRVMFIPDDPETGFVFYPGAKVQYTAYAPLMEELASRGILCVLFRMPGNLAVLHPNAAANVPGQFSTVTKWYLGGHSLGGAMASNCISDHSDDFEGLVLLGSYSNADLTDTDLSILSIYGSEDGVLSRKRYDEAKALLPEDFTEYVIEGGCHAGFGAYGPQKGDDEPTIGREEQVQQTADLILAWMGK